MENRKNVLELLTEAILDLAEEKKLAEISVSELCDRAGVSRISFYRNYGSKEEILVRYLNDCTDRWFETEMSVQADRFDEWFWSGLIQLYRNQKKLIDIIYANGMSWILQEHIAACCKVREDDVLKKGPEEEAYLRGMFAGALFGLIDVWIRRGMGPFDLPAFLAVHRIQGTDGKVQ